LGFERMFDCFEYESYSREELRQRWFIRPKTLLETQAGSIRTLIGPDNTDIFRLDEFIVKSSLTISNEKKVFSGLYVLEGCGHIEDAQKRCLLLEKASQYFVPAGTGDLKITADPASPLRIMRFFGGEN